MRSNNIIFLVSNTPTPYRQDFYSELSKGAINRKMNFETVFFSAKEPNRTWKISIDSFSYKHRILNSKLFAIGNIETYISLTPFLIWLVKRPLLTILAGAWHYPSNILIAATSFLFRRKCYFWCEANEFTDKSTGRFTFILKKLFYSSCFGFLSPGPASDRYISKLASNKHIICVPNAIENSVFVSRDKSLHRIADQRDRYIFVGELSDRKGVLELVSAFNAAISRNILPPSTKLIISGDGPLRENITKLANDLKWLEYVGFRQGPELSSQWRSCGAFVLNTKLDPSPLVVNEAIAYGLVPIVSSRAGNSKDILMHSPDFNFIFEHGDLISALDKYARTPNENLIKYRNQLYEYGDRYRAAAIAEDFLHQALSKES